MSKKGRVEMGELYKVKLSNQVIYVIDIQRAGLADWRPRLLLMKQATTSVEDILFQVKHADVGHWIQLRGVQDRSWALHAAIQALTNVRYPEYFCEIVKIDEPFNSELSEVLGTALETVAGLEERCAAAESSALQSAQAADEYKRQLAKAREELRVATQLAVEIYDAKEEVEAFVAQHVKVEA